MTNIPEGAELVVEDVAQSEYDNYLNKAAKALKTDADAFTYAKLLDISIVYENQEIQPNGTVGVEIQLKDGEDISNPQVVHFGQETEVLDAAKTDKGISFETTGFSVYVIADSGETKTNRYTYHFLTEIGEDGKASAYSFVNKAGETVSTQIVKNGESLHEVDPPVTEVEKPFTAWYIATKNEDGTYTLTDEQVVFDSPIEVGNEDKDFYIAPFFGASIIATFYDKPQGSENIHIVTKRVVPVIDGKASVKVDNITVPSTATTVLSGWTVNETEYPLAEYKTIEATENANLYPIFTEGHWLRFVGGEAGSGAEYVPAIFVTANTTTAELSTLTPSTREGYTFAGWYYGEQDSATGTITYGAQVTDGTGAVLDAADLLAKAQAEAVTLYGKWNGKQVAYRVAIWYENADDDEYSFQSVSNKIGAAGTTTTETAPVVDGFTAQTIEQQVIRGDGSTVVNIYYKRNTYNIEFYEDIGYYYSNWSKIDALTITAKYGADIHEQWPGNRPGTEEYGAAWYVSTSSQTYVTLVPTMPLNGGKYYQMSGGNRILITSFQIQSVNGGNAFTEYLQAPYYGGRDNYTTADDYIHIEGFRVNANSQRDANAIAANATGDNDAVYNNSYNRSPAIGTRWSSGQNNTLYFYYLRNQYNVILEENGGPAVSDLEDIYYEANIAATKTSEISALNSKYVKGETQKRVSGEGDYVFQGWYDNSSFLGDEFDFNQTMPAGNITLYAKWERIYYLMEIDPNGGQINADGEVTYTWLQYGDKLHQYNIQRNYVEDPNGDYTYYNVKYPGTDEEVITSTLRKADYVTDASALPEEQKKWLNPDQKYKEATTDDYYSLVGWYNTKTGTIYDFDSIITGPTSIQAKWRRSGTFDIRYNPVQHIGDVTISGTITHEQDTGYADQSVTTILNTPTGITSTDNVTYVFKGWQVVNNFEDCEVLDETYYKQGDDFTVDAAISTDHHIFMQAVYEPAENDPTLVPVTNLIFDPNGGDGERVEYDPKQINDAFDLADAPEYTREGYILVGWSQSKAPTADDAIFSTTAIVGVDNLEPTEDGKNILYAIWEKYYTLTVTKEIDGKVGYVTIPEEGFAITVKLDGANDEQKEKFKLLNKDSDRNAVVLHLGKDASGVVNLAPGMTVKISEDDYSAYGFVDAPEITPSTVTVEDEDVTATVINHAPDITETGLDINTSAAKTALLSLFAFAMMCVLGFSLKRRYVSRR